MLVWILAPLDEAANFSGHEEALREPGPMLCVTIPIDYRRLCPKVPQLLVTPYEARPNPTATGIPPGPPSDEPAH